MSLFSIGMPLQNLPVVRDAALQATQNRWHPKDFGTSASRDQISSQT